MISVDVMLGALQAAGIAPLPDAVPVALAGGVSCDVWWIDTQRGPVVVKCALPQLRVAARWLAPVERIDSEIYWLRRVRAIDPALVPAVLAELPTISGFAMTFLPGLPVWRDELFAGRVDVAFAEAVGRELARIHAATASDPDDFRGEASFAALRIEPFLRFVAERRPAVAAPLNRIADRLGRCAVTLVHGDISPKNILVAGHGPVFLDAECAVRGDPAFDLAFCVTHLLIKAVWRADPAMTAAATALVAAYLTGITWEPADDLNHRAGPLIAALLLARVYGKSPAAYLTDPAHHALIGARAEALLQSPQAADRLVANWKVDLT